ncbi:MAG: FHA domain-containing protein [Myxococcota bacterium]|nr:FHA domain-containing protein [Deltaproteobacteria bacterium]MDQ3337213.1 FHA domain-containing protein [Myxococcota bacterium]
MDVHYYIEYLGNSVELPLGETIVGRDVGCKLRFNDPAVSRRHLRFVRRANEVFVEDLKSSNGTKLNGRPVLSPTLLKDGDAILVGGRALFVHISDDQQASSQTLNLAELPSDARALRARTAPYAVTSPPATQQRCPNCGSAVTELDDECKTCRYSWGGFRAASRTDVRKGVSKRRHDRLPAELQIVYVSNELEIEATSRDLSASGIFVCTQVLDPVGTKCTLTFLVDGGPPLKFDGVVRRVVEHEDEEHSGLGVEFSRVGPQEKSWLDALIARLAK